MSHISHAGVAPVGLGHTPAQSMTPFWVIWAGQASSLLGSQLVQFALVWWLTRQTGSASVLALASLVALLPDLFLGPFAGVLVDRWNRRRVLITADLSVALATLVLAGLFALGVVQVWHVYVLIFVRALGGAFHWPAMQASTSLLVPSQHLTRVAGLNKGLEGAARIICPPLGALLLGWLPIQAVLGLDLATALLAVFPLIFIIIPQPPRAASGEETSRPAAILTDLGAGLRFLWNWPGMFFLVAIIALVHLVVVPAFALLPILATTHFHGQAFHLAWLEAAFGLGMVAGGLGLGLWGGFKRRVSTVVLALLWLGGSLLAVGFVPAAHFELAAGALFGVGLAIPLVTGSIQAIQQATVPPDLQGRIFTLVMSGSAAMSPLGLALAGPAVDSLGVCAWYLATGMVVSLMGVAAARLPAVMHLEEQAGRSS